MDRRATHGPGGSLIRRPFDIRRRTRYHRPRHHDPTTCACRKIVEAGPFAPNEYTSLTRPACG